MITLSKEPLVVSDHAICRYLERAMGLNLELVRDHIRSICEAPAAFGAVRVRAEEGRLKVESK